MLFIYKHCLPGVLVNFLIHSLGCYTVVTCTAMIEWLSSWLAEQELGPGFDSRSCHLNFRYWLSPASKSRYAWNTAKATKILNTTNKPTCTYFMYCSWRNITSIVLSRQGGYRDIFGRQESPCREKLDTLKDPLLPMALGVGQQVYIWKLHNWHVTI